MICDCGAETEGKWANKHSPGCASLKPLPVTIAIGEGAKVSAFRDGRWVILYTEDGSSITTVSLTPQQAFDLAELLKGSGITAAGVLR